MTNIDWLNKKQAAAFLGMEKQNFHYYFKEERVPGKKMFGLTPLFDKAKLQGWIPKDKRKDNGKNLPRTKRKYED